jgi:hypothetical protein
MALALAGLRIFESQSHGFQAKPKPEHHYTTRTQLLRPAVLRQHKKRK